MELKYDTATEVTDKDNVYYVKTAEGKTEYVLELTLTDTTKKMKMSIKISIPTQMHATLTAKGALSLLR